MDEIIIYIWLHRIVALSLLAISGVAIYYINKLINKMSGCFRSSFELIRNGIFLLMIRIFILNLEYWDILPTYPIVMFVRDILTVASIILITFGVIKLSRLIDLMPKSILKEINNTCE